MKTFPTQLYYFLRHGPSRRNVMALLRFVLFLMGVVSVYSILFHLIMAWEGRSEYSWVTGFYWTLTVMSTLGFGDITFQSDLGRIFSTVVLLSGIVFLLVLLPFTFIEFFYAPWMKSQAAARAPSQLPEDTRDHVILTDYDVVTRALIEKLNQYHYPYILLVSELDEALQLHDSGFKVMLGDLDNPLTYERCRARNAALVATTANDLINTNVAFTVREVAEDVPIIATANYPASVDILQLAGSNYVFQLGDMLGQALARRVKGGKPTAHIIGEFEQLLIAETTVEGTALVGKTIRESGIREESGLSVVGTWRRGIFGAAKPDTLITARTVLVLAGSEQQLKRFNDHYLQAFTAEAPIVIIGGGRVGRATGRALLERGLEYRIIEKQPQRILDPERYILGDAAELEVLERAGIMETPSIVVTTHEDDVNIYLTIYCRRLRPDIPIISRATLERNIATLHRAGADFVMSYASMGANTIMNLLDRSNILMVTEGLDLFRVEVPPALAGKRLYEARLREETGCTVVALCTERGMEINPPPDALLKPNAKMILIGTSQAERQFLERYGG